MSESQRSIEEVRESLGAHIAENARLVAEIKELKEELELARTEARRWKAARDQINSDASWILEQQRY